MNNDIYSGYIERINRRIDELMSVYTEENAKSSLVCADAMRYSLSAGGKRIRPVLALEFCRMLCGDAYRALDAACAVEMIHTFSLIHDDLPCMDDDDMRRGRPSCHKAFSEAYALLAGDALECRAFEVIADDEATDPVRRVRLIKRLAAAAGVCGMIGGQIIDIGNTGAPLSKEGLLEMYSLKTGALISCSCVFGCICAGREEYIPQAEEYASLLGLAFQIKDDILDITADESTLGKPVHSDEGMDKSTYPAVFGLEQAYEQAKSLTQRAVCAARSFPNSGFLEELTEELLKRTY